MRTTSYILANCSKAYQITCYPHVGIQLAINYSLAITNILQITYGPCLGIVLTICYDLAIAPCCPKLPMMDLEIIPICLQLANLTM
jgi:hypothetical protein